MSLKGYNSARKKLEKFVYRLAHRLFAGPMCRLKGMRNVRDSIIKEAITRLKEGDCNGAIVLLQEHQELSTIIDKLIKDFEGGIDETIQYAREDLNIID